MTKGKRRSATKPQTLPLKTQQNFTKHPVPASGSEKSGRNPTPAKKVANSKVEIVENEASSSVSSKELEHPSSPRTEISGSKYIHEQPFPETFHTSTKLIPIVELIACDGSQIMPVDVPHNGCQNMPAVTDEVSRLASLLISSPVSTSAGLGSPDFLQLGNPSKEIKNMHADTHLTELNIPQITLTTDEGLENLAPTAPSVNDDANDIPRAICKLTSLINSSICNSGSSSSDSNHKNSLFNQPSANRSFVFGNTKRPKLFTHLSKATNPESNRPIPESDGTSGSRPASPISEDSSPMHFSDFRRLKETTEKLQLSIRRPSTMLWRQQYLEGQGLPNAEDSEEGDDTDESVTNDRKQRIDEALEWLRHELQEMRSQDQNLARQLLTIRQDMHQLKLQRSTEEHQELLEDFQSELDDLQEFSDVLDLPQPVYGSNPLKHIGVTRLNISARRFSAC